VILVTGGTGFVGQRVVHALRAARRDVRCLVRNRDRAARLDAWSCELVVGDVTDVETLVRAVGGCDTVVHLVAILVGRPEDFERVMTRATRDLVAASSAAGVKRIVLMGALGTSEEGARHVPYYAAKLEMERSVQESGVEHVILRPSFVFGPGGGSLQRFARIARFAPAIPVIGDGTQRIQPIWIEDLADAVVASTELPETGRTFELGGPDVVDWNELWRRIAVAVGRRPRLVHVPPALARPPAALAELLPHPPVTRDQLTMLELGDNVCDVGPAVSALGLHLLPLDEQLRRSV